MPVGYLRTSAREIWDEKAGMLGQDPLCGLFVLVVLVLNAHSAETSLHIVETDSEYSWFAVIVPAGIRNGEVR